MHDLRSGCHCFVLLLFLLVAVNSHAQVGFFIPKSGKVFFNGDSATIFSNVINYGQLGFGKRSVVNFKGTTWENDQLSSITDETDDGNGTHGEGGILRFLLPDDSLPASVNQQQFLSGGYNLATRSGAAFSNVYLDNKWGIKLANSTTRIRNRLHFENGHIYADDHILVVGDTGPGVITGYDEKRFVITGTKPIGGYLVREKISLQDQLVVFPVGVDEDRYTPAGISLKTTDPDDFSVRVYDSVYANAINGNNMQALSVNKTWQLGKRLRPGADDVTVVLQHLLDEEGSQFNANRQNSFISQFTNSGWDTGILRFAPVTPATLTLGIPLQNSGTNSRIFNATIGSETYLAKWTGPIADSNLTSTRFKFWAYRLYWNSVQVNWTTRPEINLDYFIVQRRLATETVFTNIDTVSSSAIGGLSFDLLQYGLKDPNSYTGISYYRLVLVDYNRMSIYSSIVPVGGRPDETGITIWPNPSGGHFFAGMSGLFPIRSIVIWNALGQKIRQEEVNGRTIVALDLYIQGVYFIGFISFDGKIMETKKLVIAGDQ